MFLVQLCNMNCAMSLPNYQTVIGMCLLCPEQEHLQIDSPILMLEPERGCRWGKVSYFSAVALALHVIPVLHMTMCLHAVA